MSDRAECSMKGTLAITCLEAITSWHQRLANRGKAANTLKAYTVAAIDAARAFARRDAHLVAVVSGREVEGWLDDMAMRQLIPRTQALKLCATRTFFDYCVQQGWCAFNPCRDIRIKFRAVRVLAPELPALQAVINAIPRGAAACWRDVRDRAMLRLALDGALRSGGLISLNIPADREPHTVDLQRLTVCTRNKGGATTEPIAINQCTADALCAWLAVREAIATPGDPALFVSRCGTRITRATANNIARMRGTAAGVAGLHIHLFRHRRAGDLIERVGLKIARDHLQHAHESTTASVYGAHLGNFSRAAVRRDADIDRVAA